MTMDPASRSKSGLFPVGVLIGNTRADYLPEVPMGRSCSIYSIYSIIKQPRSHNCYNAKTSSNVVFMFIDNPMCSFHLF